MAAPQNVCCRCSKYGDTRRSGRLIHVVIDMSPSPPPGSTAGRIFSHADLYQQLANAKYSQRFLDNPTFVVLFRERAYSPYHEAEGANTKQNASIETMNQLKEEEKQINNVKTWQVLHPHRHANGVGAATSPAGVLYEYRQPSTHSEELVNDGSSPLCIDIRFVSTFIYNEITNATCTATTATTAGVTVAVNTKQNIKEHASYFGVAIMPTVQPLDPHVGTLWRSSYQQGAAFTAIVGRKCGASMNADTSTCWASVPAFKFPTFSTLLECSPYNCPIVCIAPGGVPLAEFTHPTRALYLLSDVDNGLTTDVVNRCPYRVSLPNVGGQGSTTRMSSIHAASLVLMDRHQKESNSNRAMVSNQDHRKKCATSSSSSTSGTSSSSLSTPPLPPLTTSARVFDPESTHLRVVVVAQNSCQQHAERIILYFCQTFHLSLEFYNSKNMFIFSLEQATVKQATEEESMDDTKEQQLMHAISIDVVSRRVVSGIYFCTTVMEAPNSKSNTANDEPMLKRRRTTTTTTTTTSSSSSTPSLFVPCFPSLISKILPNNRNTHGALYRMSAYPSKELKKTIACLPPTIPLDPKHATHAIYFVAVQHYLLYGIRPSIYNFSTSEGHAKYNASAVRLKQFVKPSCKLWELQQRQLLHVTSATMCLEVGNGGGGGGGGCGGWSEYIASHLQTSIGTNHRRSVYCVDPGTLRASVIHTNASRTENVVVHVPHYIQDAKVHLQHDDDGSGKTTNKLFNLFVSDVNCSIEEAIRLLQHVVPYMSVRQSTLIMTVRWNSSVPYDLIRFQQQLETIGCLKVQLLHLIANLKNERTVVAEF